MNKSSTSFSPYFYWISTLLILTAFALTIISRMNLCTEACGAAHSYRILGFPFELYGMLFFPLLALCHLLSNKSSLAGGVAAALIAGAVGMEIDFILLQKYIIKAWCPLCLSIAACIFMLAGLYAACFFLNLKKYVTEDRRSEIMKSLWKGLTSLSLVAVGFAFASLTIAKEQPLQASERSVQENIVFGNPSSPVIVYLFTDWQCPACRKLEPTIEKIVPEITKQAKLVFVDTIIHDDTVNFIPYNLSFMINNKSQYLALRHKLSEISMQTGSPTDAQVTEAIRSLGVQYKQLHYTDIEGGIKYFKHLSKHYEIDGTPQMIITTANGSHKQLLSGSQITEENVLKAIQQALK